MCVYVCMYVRVCGRERERETALGKFRSGHEKEKEEEERLSITAGANIKQEGTDPLSNAPAFRTKPLDA